MGAAGYASIQELKAEQDLLFPPQPKMQQTPIDPRSASLNLNARNGSGIRRTQVNLTGQRMEEQ